MHTTTTTARIAEDHTDCFAAAITERASGCIYRLCLVDVPGESDQLFISGGAIWCDERVAVRVGKEFATTSGIWFAAENHSIFKPQSEFFIAVAVLTIH